MESTEDAQLCDSSPVMRQGKGHPAPIAPNLGSAGRISSYAALPSTLQLCPQQHHKQTQDKSSSAQSSRTRGPWQRAGLDTCVGLHFHPCSFPQTSSPLLLTLANAKATGVQGAWCRAWCYWRRFYCRTLMLTCVCLCQPNHSAPFLSREEVMDWLLTICLAHCKACGGNRSFQCSN